MRRAMIRAFDIGATLLWSAMILAFVGGLAINAFWPPQRVYYPAATAMCDAGCADLR